MINQPKLCGVTHYFKLNFDCIKSGIQIILTTPNVMYIIINHYDPKKYLFYIYFLITENTITLVIIIEF